MRSNSNTARLRAILVLIPLIFLLLDPADAEGNLESQTKFDYLEKVLTLRHFYTGDHLRFHADGTIEGAAPKTGPWTLDGQLQVEDVHLRGSHLLVTARRIHRIFDAQTNPVDQLRSLENDRGKKDKGQKELEKTLRRLRAEIEIDLPSETPNQNDVTSAIHAVFLANADSMVEVVPDYWRSYFDKQEGKPQEIPKPKSPTEHIGKGGGVSPPRVMSQPDPDYSPEARKAKYQGTVVLQLMVDTTGKPKALQVVRPLGLGLDERAVAAVTKWRFAPAQKDGKPVAVLINIELSFHL